MKKIVRAYFLFAAGIAITTCFLAPFLLRVLPSFFPLTVGEHLSFILTLLLSIPFPGHFESNWAFLFITVHPCLYLLLNLYVLRRVARNIKLTPTRAFLPSEIVVRILTVLSILYWFSQWHGGLYGGSGDPIDLVRFGIMNAVVLLLLFIAPYVLMQRLASYKKPFSEVLILGYNFCVYVAFLLVLFPWMGEAFL